VQEYIPIELLVDGNDGAGQRHHFNFGNLVRKQLEKT